MTHRLDTIDPDFVSDLERSQEAVVRVGEWLQQWGYPVQIPPLRIRPSAAERAEYGDSGDLLVTMRVEVKRRLDIDFTSSADFPYGDIIVDVCHSWDRARPKPLSYYILNKSMTWAIVVPHSSRRKWRRQEIYDRNANRKRAFYLCPLRHCEFVYLGDPQ